MGGGESISPHPPRIEIDTTDIFSIIQIMEAEILEARRELKLIPGSGTETERLIEDCCRAAGITSTRVYKKLDELLDAKMRVLDKYGDVVVVGPDNKVQLATALKILELVKHLGEKEGASTVVARVGIQLTEEAANRIADSVVEYMSMKRRIPDKMGEVEVVEEAEMV